MIDNLAFDNYYHVLPNKQVVLIVKPTREQINNLKIGDLVIDCFGRIQPVTQIYARNKTLLTGKAYVCTYVKFNESSEISMSFEENEIVRTLQVCDNKLY